MSRLKKLVLDIHRRSLWQVVVIYVSGAWACYEIIDTVTDRLALPVWLPVLAIIFFLRRGPSLRDSAGEPCGAPGGVRDRLDRSELPST